MHSIQRKTSTEVNNLILQTSKNLMNLVKKDLKIQEDRQTIIKGKLRQKKLKTKEMAEK
jgi:hypothetical protein